MRTAIFLGCTAIADAIRKDWLTDTDTIAFAAIALMIMILMDIAEFIKKMRSKAS